MEIDPNFAIAYAEQSASYNNLNEAGQAAENARKAYELREKVSERERLGIEATYYLFVTAELEKAAQTYEEWQQIYPRDIVPYGDLGFIFASLGNPEKALEETLAGMRLRPDDANSYANLGGIYMDLNWLDAAEASYKQAEERKLKGEYLLLNRYGLAFLKADRAQMAQLVGGRHGQAGRGRPAVGHARRHRGLVRKVERRTRTNAARDGLGPAQRRQRDRRNVSGCGGSARGGIGKPSSRLVPMPTRR